MTKGVPPRSIPFAPHFLCISGAANRCLGRPLCPTPTDTCAQELERKLEETTLALEKATGKAILLSVEQVHSSPQPQLELLAAPVPL